MLLQMTLRNAIVERLFEIAREFRATASSLALFGLITQSAGAWLYL